MDEQGKISNNQCTTIPLADGWYLRDSKSNPGRKYYFNPSIKQSFWHITDDEIKVLEKKTKDQTSGTKNNKPSNLAIPLEECNTSGPKIATIMHPIVRYNELPYDPSIWAAPPTAEIIPTALINPLNPLPSLPNQTALAMARSSLQSIIPHDTNVKFNKNRFPSNINNCQQSKPRKYTQMKSHTIAGDLRDELKNRRIQSSNSTGSRVNTKRRSFENVTWDEETVKTVLQFLIRKIAPEANQNCWYVVPDVNVVEKHSTLLSMMTNLVHTDIVKRCCLKVPPVVMMKLKDIAEEPGNTSIRRFVRFHCTETFPERQSNAEHNETASIIDTCMKLLEDNYHVVVLCQDLLFKDLRMSLTNPVFTIPNLMLFIENFKYKVPQDTVLSKKVECEKNTANDKNNSEEILSNVIENSRSTIKSEMLCEESQTALETNEENDSKSISSNSLAQINPIILNNVVEETNSRTIVTSLNQHAVPNNTPQKRKIKLKRTCDTNTSSGQSSARRRWSAMNIGKKKKDIGSAEAVQCTQNDDVTENIDKDNLHKESNIEHKCDPKKELPKEDNDYSKILSSTESCFIAPSTSLTSSNTEYKVDTVQNETNSKDVNQSSLSTTKECNDDQPKNTTIDETTVESLATQETKYVPWYLDLIENILLRILHKKPTVVMKDLPQLERLHKATIEVIKNYSHCCYVVDAANKLSMKLNELSKKGAININKKFLEDADIYSHVVNLIKSLEDENQNDEDIQSAKSLLKNILHDIHKPCLNVADQLQETSAAGSQHNKGSEDIIDAPISELEITPSVETDSKIEPEKNDFNANKRKLEEAAKIKHFRALKLRKVDHNLPKISNEDSGALNDSTNKDSEPFSKTATTESTGDNINSLETEDNKLDIEYDGDVIEPQDFLNENNNSNLQITNNADNEKFKLFIAMFLKEIRETFLVCAQYVETCLTQENGKNVVNDEINEVYGILCKIWQSLDSILTRDSGDVNNNFKSVLNKAGLNINIDQNTCDEYRDIVYKCKDEVKAFLNLIESRRVTF